MADTIYIPFKKAIFDLFLVCPAIFGIIFVHRKIAEIS